MKDENGLFCDTGFHPKPAKSGHTYGDTMIGYLDGQYLPQENIVISPEDRGFLFADGIYEVIRTYSGKLFQAKAHLDRLSRGARELQFNHTDFRFLEPVFERLIQDNQLTQGDALIYMQVGPRGCPQKSCLSPYRNTPDGLCHGQAFPAVSEGS